MKNFFKKNCLSLSWAIIISLLIVKDCQHKNLKQNLIEQTGLVSSLNDTIKIWKDKDSLSHSKIEVIKTSNTKNFINLKSNDKEVQELQKLVKSYGDKLKKQGSVTIFSSNTNVDTTIVTKVDTIDILKDKLIIKKPLYYSSFNLKGWVTGITKATEDSIQINLKVKNEYSVIIGEESQGWFKPKKPFVEVINKNPYSETIKLKTYQVEITPIKKIGVGAGVYYGVGSDFQSQVFVGVGIQYNFIRL